MMQLLWGEPKVVSKASDDAASSSRSCSPVETTRWQLFLAQDRARQLEEDVAWWRAKAEALQSRRTDEALVGALARIVGWCDREGRFAVAWTSRSWRAASGARKMRRVKAVPSSTRDKLALEARRFAAWMHLLDGVDATSKSMVPQLSPSELAKLDFSDDEDDEAPRGDEAIELDLRRTHDSADIDPLRTTLRRVCDAHPGVGYCQGMNFVASFLLRRSRGDVDGAVFVFTKVYAALDLRSVYGTDMPGLKLLVYQLEKLLERHVPRLAARLGDLQLPAMMFATSWFVTVLVNFLPEDDAIVAWDELVSLIASLAQPPPFDDPVLDATRGWALVFRVVLLALEAVEADLLDLTFDDTLKHLQHFPTLFPPNTLADCLVARRCAFDIGDHALDRQLDALGKEYAARRREDHVVEPDRMQRALDYSRAVVSRIPAPPRLRRRASRKDDASSDPPDENALTL